MTADPKDIGELERLLASALDERLSEPERARLGQLLRDHADDAESYVEMAVLHALLRWEHAPPLRVSTTEARKNDACGMTDDELPEGVPSPGATGPLHPIHHSSFIIRDSEDHSSFVPYASSLLGGVALSYSIAALMLGIGILAAWTWKAPGIPADPLAGLSTVEVVKNAAPRGGPSSVGRITRMRDCEWLNADIGSRNVLDVVIGSKYIVHAGRMEITYASGVKVVLNGPAVYEVDGRNSGSLRLGSAAFFCKAPPGAKQRAQGEKGARAATGAAAPADEQFFCVHVSQGASPPVMVRLQDVNLTLSVNRQGEVVTRMLSPAEMSVGPDGMKNVRILNDPSVIAKVGPNHTPLVVVVKRPPGAKTGPPTPAETTASSGDASQKKHDEGVKKPRNHGVDS